jgi:hypothetical protein
MRQEQSRQPDLFESDRRARKIPVSLRREMVRLVEDLLIEALGGGARQHAQSQDPAKREAAHDQDHA